MNLILSTILLCASFSAWAVSCMEEQQTPTERSNETCATPYVHPDPHRRGILQMVAIRDAIVEEVLWADSNGVFGIRNGSRLPVSECRQFFQDLIFLNDIEVITEGSKAWATINAGTTLPRLDPRFKEWRFAQGRQVIGYVVVRWRNSNEFLIRARRACGGIGCSSLTFQHLDAHDESRPIACSAMTVETPYWRNWKGQVTPIWLEIPGAVARKKNAATHLAP